MRIKTCLALLLGVIFLVGCKPTIDGSSKETAETSAKKVKESLPADQQGKFDAAMMVVMMKSGMEAATPADAEKKALSAVNGKTGEEIIAEAEKLDPSFKGK